MKKPKLFIVFVNIFKKLQKQVRDNEIFSLHENIYKKTI